MRNRRSLPFLAVLMILMYLAATEVTAQNLCSGRCTIDRKTGDPACGLSLFGHVMCVDVSTGCAEFGCQSLTPASRVAPVGSSPAVSALGLGAAPPGQVGVSRLKGRT
jgi:hypothetical protein